MHRDALDWGWRSHARVADQVARGVDALLDPEAPVATGTTPVVPPTHPDSVAAALAVLAAGLPLGFATEGWWAPACRGGLDREPLQELGARLDPATADAPIETANGTRRARDLVADARRLLADLPSEPVAPRRGARRPIVTTGADLPPECLLTIAVAGLLVGAVWALEPQADAFASAVTWTRPTLVVATAAELDALAAAWDRSDRRWSRLRAIVRWVPGTEGDVSSTPAATLTEQIGAPVVTWDTSRRGAARVLP